MTLDDLLAHLWTQLRTAVDDRAHPLRTPVFCTQGRQGPNARTLVLRGADADTNTLMCFSDTRAGKWADINQCADVAWVFYDPVARVQLRARGQAKCLTEGALVERHWRAQAGAARNNYRTFGGPGQPLDGPTDGIPDAQRGADSNAGREHFGLIVTRLSELDWLDLSGERHHRARFIRTSGDWQGQWIAP